MYTQSASSNALLRILGCIATIGILSCASDAQRKKTVVGPPTILPGPELWLTGYVSEAVHRYDARTGQPVGNLEPIPGAQSIRVGPDGLIYVCAEESNEVWRYRGTRFVDVFIGDDPNTPGDESGGLDGPTAATFGPDGNLYVASFNNDKVLRFDGSTGSFLGVFVKQGTGGLNGPDNGMVFGPDGHLYVPSYFSHEIIRYNGAFGFSMGKFVPALRGGLRNPRMLLFLEDGSLFVSSEGSNRILHFDDQGAFIEQIAAMSKPTGFAINPADGDLYITSVTTSRVRRFDLFSRTFVGTFIPDGSAGVSAATYLAFIHPVR